MLDNYFCAPKTLRRLRIGLSGPYIDSFAYALELDGYSPQVLFAISGPQLTSAASCIASLWLGHSTLATTEIYVRADPSQKLEAIEAVVPPHLRKGKFRPPGRLIAMLKTKS